MINKPLHSKLLYGIYVFLFFIDGDVEKVIITRISSVHLLGSRLLCQCEEFRTLNKRQPAAATPISYFRRSPVRREAQRRLMAATIGLPVPVYMPGVDSAIKGCFTVKAQCWRICLQFCFTFRCLLSATRWFFRDKKFIIRSVNNWQHTAFVCSGLYFSPVISKRSSTIKVQM